MKIRQPRWLNKERLAFLLMGLWLAVVTLGLFHSRVVRERVTPPTVLGPRPEPLRVDVACVARQGTLADKLHGHDPFRDPFRQIPIPEPEKAEESDKPEGPKGPVKPDDLPDKPESGNDEKKKEIRKVPPSPPEPYQVPVDWVGWIARGGERVAVLRERQGGALLRVREGDWLALHALTVVQVRAEGVVIRNALGVNHRLERVEDPPAPAGNVHARQVREFNIHG